MVKHFIKYVDNDGNVLYKENGFNLDNNKLVAMNIILKEDK